MSELLTPEALVGMKERCARATPPPWHLTADRQSIIQTKHITRDVWEIPHCDADMDFIAASAGDLPAALALIADLLDVIAVTKRYAEDAGWGLHQDADKYTTPAWRSVATSLRKGST